MTTMTDSDALMQIYRQACQTVDQQVAGLQEKFQSQMQCRRGCSSCCESVSFRIRAIEAQALWEGYQQASSDIQKAIRKNLQNPKAGHEQDCPVLIDGACGLYADRPALCRAY